MTEPVRPLEALIAEMRTIGLVAGQCSVELPDNPHAAMAAAEAERALRWADELDALIAAGLSEAPQDECTCDGGDQGDGLCAVPHDPTCPRRDSDR